MCGNSPHPPPPLSLNVFPLLLLLPFALYGLMCLLIARIHYFFFHQHQLRSTVGYVGQIKSKLKKNNSKIPRITPSSRVGSFCSAVLVNIRRCLQENTSFLVHVHVLLEMSVTSFPEPLAMCTFHTHGQNMHIWVPNGCIWRIFF